MGSHQGAVAGGERVSRRDLRRRPSFLRAQDQRPPRWWLGDIAVILICMIVGACACFVISLPAGCGGEPPAELDAAPNWPPCHKVGDYCNFEDGGFGACHPEGCEPVVLHYDDGGIAR